MSDWGAVQPRLYKYCRPPVIEYVLKQKTLRFTRAKDFNDPFELFPTMDSFLRPLMSALLLEKAKADDLGQLRAAIERMPDRARDVARQVGLEQFHKAELSDESSDSMAELRERVTHAIRK